MNCVLQSEAHLISAALTLGAARIRRWSSIEEKFAARIGKLDRPTIEWLRAHIQKGNDPLGDGFCRLRAPEQRREKGATYTPLTLVKVMVEWAKRRGETPSRIIDPGTGSGRFLVAAGRVFPRAELIGVDVDPVAAIIARGHLAAAGLEDRSCVLLGDYRTLGLPRADGRTFYVGNPPYVRHHLLCAEWKRWLTEKAERLGYQASQLAGLHVHFFLATVLQAKPGDFGCFITAAEWLDVNYGNLVRNLFLYDLGGQSLTVIEPTALPFADAATTAVISTFEIGAKPRGIRVKRVADVGAVGTLDGGRLLHRGRLESQTRWSHLTRQGPKQVPSGHVELGELCRVHRGQVTGANRVWIAGKHSEGLPPSVLFPTVTRARELFEAGSVLVDSSGLRQVIDIPVDLSVFEGEERRAVVEFLRRAKRAGASRGYVAENRRAWWSVGLKHPAPILATYMARRPPAFVRNRAEARHINIAHGLYPRDPLAEDVLVRLVNYLSKAINVTDGRTYAGGLTKFEPREMERITVPEPKLLLQLEG
ncbi:MAG: N-6 DNA methylase [Acidobacteriia bacterium]|nr:N-6 DNA methylase [Terriglobia bacterium]